MPKVKVQKHLMVSKVFKEGDSTYRVDGSLIHKYGKWLAHWFCGTMKVNNGTQEMVTVNFIIGDKAIGCMCRWPMKSPRDLIELIDLVDREKVRMIKGILDGQQ